MDYNIIKDIANRLKGLREAMGISVYEMSKNSGVSEKIYLGYESGEVDIPLTVLHQVCKQCNVDISDVLLGETPHNALYAITCANEGTQIIKNDGYTYEALAHSFKSKKVDPYVFVLKNGHSTEVPDIECKIEKFYYILDGKVEFKLSDKVVTLSKGDSMYFNAAIYHRINVLEGEEARILIMVI